jgi:hypothetical protein
VGPGKDYPTPCMAIAAATTNEEIQIDPGTYTDTCEINTAGLWIHGVNGQPKMDASNTAPVDGKGIFVVSADLVTISNLEFMGAHVDDSLGGNAAALRITGHEVVVQGCYIHDNQNGILAAPIVDGGSITIENTELSHNGLGDACDQGGCTHNVYVSDSSSTVRYDQTIFQFNWTHDLASDTPDKGHLLKSRSRETQVLYNRITGETGHDSYEVDLPNGGLGIVIGNVIEKGPSADNSILLSYAEEGNDTGIDELDVAFNTFVNDFSKGTFIQAPSGATLNAHDNIFAGPGTLASTGSLPPDNLSGVDPLFVAPAAFDYHLQGTSPAIGKGVTAGTVQAAVTGGTITALVPLYEYVQPLGSTQRVEASDIGAFQFGTPQPAPDAGASSGSASSGSASSSGEPSSGSSSSGQTSGDPSGFDAGSASSGAGAGATPSDSTASCSCKAAGSRGGNEGAGALAGLALVAVAVTTRRRQKPTRLL